MSSTELTAPRRAGEFTGRRDYTAEPLFDAFWREGELALLFGEAGAGKSVLAVQIADNIARGRDPMGNAGRRKRRKVLYVDLVLTDKQFGARYGSYKFSRNLFRDSPPDTQDLFAWLTAMVKSHVFNAVVIDDLSMVSRACDGTRETFELMRSLRRLTVETGVSILVLADSFPFAYGRENASPERDLRRSRVLCGVADSVFAIHNNRLMQTRTRSGEMVWTSANAIECKIESLDSGMLGIKFEINAPDDEHRHQILEVKAFHENEKYTFREVANVLGISKSQAQRLYAEWTPEMGALVDDEDLEEDDTDVEREFHEDSDEQPYLDELAQGDAELFDDDMPRLNLDDDPRAVRSINDLDSTIDTSGQEIFVETWDEHRRKPVVWYKRMNKGYHRFKRGTVGIEVKSHDGFSDQVKIRNV